MINAAKELGRTVGYKPVVTPGVGIEAEDHIVSGHFVKLLDHAGETCVHHIAGTESAAEVDLLGIAADDTKRLDFNGLYAVIDNFCKYGKVAAFVCGGMFTVWDDSRGAVFASGAESSSTGSVLNVAPGTPLYIDANGLLSTEVGAADTIGAIAVGSVIRAPKAADGTLFFKAKGL